MIALLLLFSLTTHAAEVGVNRSVVHDAVGIISSELNPAQSRALDAFLAAPMPGLSAALPPSMDRIEAAIKLRMIHDVVKKHGLASANALRLLRSRTSAISSILSPEGRKRLDAAVRQTTQALRGTDRDEGEDPPSAAPSDRRR